MMNHLRQLGLPEEARTRGLHILAEKEAAKVFEPFMALLVQVIENQLSVASVQTAIEGRRSDETRNGRQRSNRLEPSTDSSADSRGTQGSLTSQALSHLEKPKTPINELHVNAATNQALMINPNYEYNQRLDENSTTRSRQMSPHEEANHPQSHEHGPTGIHPYIWQQPSEVPSVNQTTQTAIIRGQISPTTQVLRPSDQLDPNTISIMHPCVYPQFILPTSIDTVVPSTSPQYFLPTSMNAEGLAYPQYGDPAVDIMVSSNFPHFTPFVSESRTE